MPDNDKYRSELYPEGPFPMKDEPVLYGQGNEARQTDDALVKLLARKYDVPTNDGVALTEKYRAEGRRDGTVQGLEREAMQGVADREMRRMQLITRYGDIAKRLAAGDQVAPEDKRYFEAVENRYRQTVYERAQAAGREAQMAVDRSPVPTKLTGRMQQRPMTGEYARRDGKLYRRTDQTTQDGSPMYQHIPIVVTQAPTRSPKVQAIANALGLDEGSAAKLAMKFGGR